MRGFSVARSMLFSFFTTCSISAAAQNRSLERSVDAMTYYADPNNSENQPTSPWHRFRPGREDRHTSILFWLTVLGLGCTSMLLVTWIASNALAKKRAEKLLQLDPLLSKLKSVHGEPKLLPRSEPEPSELAHPKDRQTPEAANLPVLIDQHLVAVETPEPPRFKATEHLIPQVELVPVPVFETCDEPVVFLQPCTYHPGDSPMIRTWKSLTMYALLSASAVTLAPPPPAVSADEKKQTKDEETAKALKALTERIAALENKKLTDADKKEIAEVMRKELKTLEDGALSKLNEKVDGLKTNVDSLQTKMLEHKLLIDHQKTLIEQLTKRLDAVPATPTTPAVDKALLETLNAIKDGIAKLGPTTERKSMSAPDGQPPRWGESTSSMYTTRISCLTLTASATASQREHPE